MRAGRDYIEVFLGGHPLNPLSCYWTAAPTTATLTWLAAGTPVLRASLLAQNTSAMVHSKGPACSTP